MCGRYRLTTTERWLSDYFNLDPEDVDWAARWNVAPTQEVAIIRQDPKEPQRTWAMARWGLIPSWAKDASIGFKAINAVAATASEKPAFRDAMRLRRCLVPADGFYEWKKLGPKEKQPYNFGMVDDGLFAFAGLWERWRDTADGQTLETCTILTTSPNSLVADVHDRMPAILSPADYEQWLDPGITNPQRVVDLLKPFDAQLMRGYPVSNRVNRVENDDSECVREVPANSHAAQTLF